MLMCIIMYPFLDEKTEAQRGQVIFLKSQSDRNRTELNPRLPDSRDRSHNRSAIYFSIIHHITSQYDTQRQSSQGQALGSTPGLSASHQAFRHQPTFAALSCSQIWGIQDRFCIHSRKREARTTALYDCAGCALHNSWGYCSQCILCEWPPGSVDLEAGGEMLRVAWHKSGLGCPPLLPLKNNSSKTEAAPKGMPP